MLTKVLLLALLAGLASAAPLETRQPFTEIGYTTNVVERDANPDAVSAHDKRAQVEFDVKEVKREAQGNDHQPWGNGKREAQNDHQPWGNGKREAQNDHQPWGNGKREAQNDHKPWGTGKREAQGNDHKPWGSG